MSRRFKGKMLGQRYLGDDRTFEVHDLDNEKALCAIDAIIRDGHEVPFETLEAADLAGYENCRHCFARALQR
ncbi:MAG TPA: hypothetical protein VNL72_00990 [Gammaproteobacteria bacterium]|nr:hypothetical protein [Gammaproteobacteria bacterium]